MIAQVFAGPRNCPNDFHRMIYFFRVADLCFAFLVHYPGLDCQGWDRGGCQ